MYRWPYKTCSMWILVSLLCRLSSSHHMWQRQGGQFSNCVQIEPLSYTLPASSRFEHIPGVPQITLWEWEHPNCQWVAVSLCIMWYIYKRMLSVEKGMQEDTVTSLLMKSIVVHIESSHATSCNTIDHIRRCHQHYVDLEWLTYLCIYSVLLILESCQCN